MKDDNQHLDLRMTCTSCSIKHTVLFLFPSSLFAQLVFPEALLLQPLVIHSLIIFRFAGGFTHQAAPTTDREMARPMPRLAHMKGDVSVRNLPVKTETKYSILSLN